MSRHTYQPHIGALPGLAQLLIALVAVDEAVRPEFEARMRGEGVTDFTRAPSGPYNDAMLQWSWEDWRLFKRAGVPA